ncbi:MAG TPA: hypothetical protein VK425_05680, partial [Acidimicrobiales bacterium]|nr:hypothetical protein [Acidimicrobiales bacterium]
MTALCVGLVATKASWSQALRAHVRDHGQDIELEVVMDGASLRRVLQRLDVLVIDDVMRTFSFADIARARDADVHVIGLCDAAEGMGRQYLLALGAEEVTSAAAPPAELVSRLAELRPRQSGDSAARPLLPPLRAVGLQRRRPRGQLTAWTKVSGGAGLTELVVGAAEELSGHANALLVEAEEISAVLLSRLCRAPEAGLAWALARARQGLPAVKDALSGLRNDGAPPVGHFDVLCAPAGPSQVISGSLLDKVLEEATGAYDHVLVETGWLVALTSARERFSSTTVVLQRAGTVVVVASADPEGAAQLVHWKALA